MDERRPPARPAFPYQRLFATEPAAANLREPGRGRQLCARLARTCAERRVRPGPTSRGVVAPCPLASPLQSCPPMTGCIRSLAGSNAALSIIALSATDDCG